MAFCADEMNENDARDEDQRDRRQPDQKRSDRREERPEQLAEQLADEAGRRHPAQDRRRRQRDLHQRGDDQEHEQIAREARDRGDRRAIAQERPRQEHHLDGREERRHAHGADERSRPGSAHGTHPVRPGEVDVERATAKRDERERGVHRAHEQQERSGFATARDGRRVRPLARGRRVGRGRASGVRCRDRGASGSEERGHAGRESGV
ncbi:MAG: hypothetical protein V9F82_00175 [Dermatophilaceae bacterium]